MVLEVAVSVIRTTNSRVMCRPTKGPKQINPNSLSSLETMEEEVGMVRTTVEAVVVHLQLPTDRTILAAPRGGPIVSVIQVCFCYFHP